MIKKQQLRRARKFEKIWFFGIGIIAILAFSAGCGCSAKMYQIANNFNFSKFQLSKLMIMNLEDGNHVVTDKPIDQVEKQTYFNRNLGKTLALGSILPQADKYHNNKEFFLSQKYKLPIATNKFTENNKGNIKKCQDLWHTMFKPATRKSDINFDPRKPYDNILFSRFLAVYDCRSKQTQKQNSVESKGTTSDTKNHNYNQYGNLMFGDYQNKLKKSFTSDDAKKLDLGYSFSIPNENSSDYNCYPIDITIAVNWRNPQQTASKIPVGSEMDISMQFIFNTDIVLQTESGSNSAKKYQRGLNSTFSSLKSNLITNGANSPVLNPFYENILQFENVTNVTMS